MQETGIPDRQLNPWVRAVLAHLYDSAFLQTHPLALLLDQHKRQDEVVRAQTLRRVLLDCIETLRPQQGQGAFASAARSYAILTYRYVDGLPMDEIATKLAISRRQAYREHEKGIEAVVSLLQEGHLQHLALGHDSMLTLDSLQIAHAEVSRLRQTVHLEVLNLAELIHSIAAMLAPLSHESGVAIEVSSNESLPSVLADRVLLRQALISIFNFGFEIADGDVAVTPSVADRRVLLRIRTPTLDNAPCSDDSMSNAFDHSDQSCVELVVASALVEAQGGHVKMDSSQRDGEWLVEVSLVVATEKPTVLVIDDNAEIVELLRRYLGGHHVFVVGVSDSEEALRVSAELQPKMITLDVMMPHLDGWDVLQRLKCSPQTAQIPVIVCSVLNEPKLAMAMGASGYLTKPVSQSDFLTVAQRWLGALPMAG